MKIFLLNAFITLFGFQVLLFLVIVMDNKTDTGWLTIAIVGMIFAFFPIRAIFSWMDWNEEDLKDSSSNNSDNG